MPKQDAQHFSWKVLEFEKHDRGVVWYLIAGTTIALLLLYSIFTANFLFGLLTLITTFILFARHIVDPQAVDCDIFSEGIRVGGRNYPYTNIRFFWIVRGTGDSDILYIELKGGLRDTLPIPIYDHDAETIRGFLQQYIEEDQSRKFEPFAQTLARILKL